MITINPNNRQNPSFNAQFVMKVPIMRYNIAEKIYKPFEADLVKLERKVAGDFNLTKEVCESEDFNLLGTYLLRLWQERKWNTPYVKSNSVYALVKPSEDKDYSRTDVDDVLGITEFVEFLPDDVRTDKTMYLITSKKYQTLNRSKDAEYNGIGHGISEAIKVLYPKRPISCFSVYESLNFWKKQGYIQLADRSFVYNG